MKKQNVYPEHEKLRDAKAELGTEHIGQFLDWLSHEGVILARWEDSPVANGESVLTPTYEAIQVLLARYADIDLEKLEKEKSAMLDEIRNPHGPKPPPGPAPPRKRRPIT